MNKIIFLLLITFVSVSFLPFNGNEIVFNKENLTGKSKTFYSKLKGKRIKLQPNAYLAFKEMQTAAKEDGIEIQLISGYRNFNHQTRLWNRKMDAFIKKGYSVKNAIKKVTEYTAIPGTSRHHWGTDIDIRDSKLKNERSLVSKDINFHHWLTNNAHKYSYYLTYDKNPFREGYNYESWHFTYRPTSAIMLQEYLKLDVLKIIQNDKVKGSEFFTKEFVTSYIDKYVLGINTELF